MQHLLLLHEQHPTLWVGMSVLPGKKLWRHGCLWPPPKRHTKFFVVVAVLEVPNYFVSNLHLNNLCLYPFFWYGAGQRLMIQTLASCALLW